MKWGTHMTYEPQYHQLIDTLEDFPETYTPSPRHSIDPARSVSAMMPCKIAADFYWVSTQNKNRRFLAVEADTTGDSSDTGDVVLYGLTWRPHADRWMPMYISLRELAEHECVILPQYPAGDTISAALQLLE